jgi:enoyl-[acyl-carrier protein] reductase II
VIKVKDLTKVLGVKYPIIGGPMAWTSMADLVSEISNAGALGDLGVGFAPTDVVEQQIKATQAKTTNPFAINVTISDFAEENLQRITEIACKYQLKFIYADNFSGLNQELTQKWFETWHQAGIKVIAKVSTAKEAIVADQAGAEVIVAKGREGGGHMTQVGTLALIPEVVDVVKQAAVVASGGIADGRGYAAARILGATGIEMGTIFLAAAEDGIHENVKQAVINANAEDLVMTGYSTQAPCWQISNQLSAEILKVERELPQAVAAKQVAELAGGSLKIASEQGDVAVKGAVMPGQIVSLVKEEKKVQTIITEIYQTGTTILQQAAKIANHNE